MRVFSKSQGKFIETGGQTTAPATGGGTDALSSLMGGSDMLTQILLMKTLQNAGSVKGGRYLDLYKTMKPAGPTAETRNRQEAIKPALAMISEIEQKKLPDVGYMGAITTPLLLKTFGGRGVSPDIEDLDSLYGNLRQVVLKSYQGGRMSDADFRQANAYIPTISDEPSRAKIKLKNLKVVLNKITNNSYSPDQDESELPSLDSFVYE